jgi:molybdenum cofactor cytidylyltransferase
MSIAAIILAAGRSTRMGTNKLLEPLGDRPLVRHVAESALSSKARPIIVVTGHESAAVEGALAGCDLRFERNPDFAQGLSTSLRVGIAAVPEDAEGVLVFLGDMPLVEAGLVDRVIAAFRDHPGRLAAVPVHSGEWGNPVLLSSALFGAVGTLEGDAGARKLITAHRDAIIEVPVESDAVLTDLDTPEALAKARMAWG